MRIMIRSRLPPRRPPPPDVSYAEENNKPHGEAWFPVLPATPPASVPQRGDQFIMRDGRAFFVDLVEWRYDLGEVHLFCTEYPRQKPPVHSCVDPTNKTACEGCIAEGRI